MRKVFLKTSLLALLIGPFALMAGQAWPSGIPIGRGQLSDSVEKSLPLLVINGTDASASFTINGQDLQADQPISITASAGFSVTPGSLPANTKNARITVTLTSSRKETKGIIILRSGDTRSYVNLDGFGTPLPTKDITKSPQFKGGEDATFVKTAGEGFNPAKNGYTLEFKVNTDDVDKEFFPYVVNGQGIGFKAYISSGEIGLYSASNKKAFPNPATKIAGLGKFYNDDKRAHTYRYAVTADDRVFIYRDGLPVDTVRAVDFGLQPDFATGNGDPVENLLKNPDFEGEFNAPGGKMAKSIAGWDILIGDIYNSEQYIVKQEISNEQDFDNHVLQMQRYKWADGWSAAEVAQVVDVAPNETYTLSALARGGIKKEGSILAKIKIQELQDNTLGTETEITSDSWETYSVDHTTSANCKQLRIVFYLERDKWGATISPLEVDNVKLTGKSRTYTPKIGFENTSSHVDYFTYDLSGAYAPQVQPAIQVSVGN